MKVNEIVIQWALKSQLKGLVQRALTINNKETTGNVLSPSTCSVVGDALAINSNPDISINWKKANSLKYYRGCVICCR